MKEELGFCPPDILFGASLKLLDEFFCKSTGVIDPSMFVIHLRLYMKTITTPRPFRLTFQNIQLHACFCSSWFCETPHAQTHSALFPATANTLPVTEAVKDIVGLELLKAAFLDSDYRTGDFHKIARLCTWQAQVPWERRPKHFTDIWSPKPSGATPFDRKSFKPVLFTLSWVVPGRTRSMLWDGSVVWCPRGPHALDVWIPNRRPTWTAERRNPVT